MSHTLCLRALHTLPVSTAEVMCVERETSEYIEPMNTPMIVIAGGPEGIMIVKCTAVNHVG